MTARTMVAVAGILIAAPSAAQQQAADLLERRASEIFVEGGDVLDFLPELVAQLEIPAALELGYLVPRGRLIERPGDQGPLVDMTVLPEERLIRRFEFARGTVRAALDTLCERNPSLRWQASGGHIRVVRTGHRDADLDAQLNHTVHRFRVRDEPLHSALARLAEAARPPLAAKQRATPSGWFLGGEGWGSTVFPPRLPMDPSVSVERTESTLRQVLDTLVRQVEGAFWIAYTRKEGMPFPEPNRTDPGRESHVLVTRASPARRTLEVKILVRCLHRTYKPLHGYADVTVRIDDARRELKRRHHFHAKTVREALPPERIERLACAPNSWEAQQCLMWIFSLNDPVLSERAIGEVLALEEAERRFLLILVFPPPSPNGEHIPLWRRLSEDRDPRVRKWARNLLGAIGVPQARAAADDSLDREVDQVYVRAGDVQYRLPELMAQLKLRAVVELGRLKEPRSGGRFEPTEDYPYYEPDPPPPDQAVKAFELVEGTVSQALDAYCRLNPQLEWEDVNGTVWIRRKSAGATMLKKVLALRIPEYALPQDRQRLDGDTSPLTTHMRHLMASVNNKLERRVAGYGTELLCPWEPGSAERFPTHEPLGSRPLFQRENETVKEILLEVIEPFPNLIVLLTGNDRTCGAKLVNWVRMRRQLNLKQLASAYTLQPEPLFGCTNVTMRMDSALRELRRRHHFEPKRVVEALIEQGTIEALVQPMGPEGAIPVTTLTLGGLFRMNDPMLTKHAADVILKLPDPVARYHFVSGSIPRPYQPGFDLVLPVWKQLAHDEYPSTRTLAHMMLDWHEKRPARLKSVEESD